jgi:hypothetical protein
MNTRQLGLRAMPLTFLVYCVEAGLAVFASFPLASELAPRLFAFAGTPVLQAAALDPAALSELAALTRGSVRSHGLAMLALFMLAPWLQMSWLSALAEPQSPLRALRQGARRLPRVWLLALASWMLTALLAAPFIALAFGASGWLHDHAQRHDLALVAALAPLLPLFLYAHVAHDLARAAALDRRALRSCYAGFRAALRVRAWLPGAAAILTGLLLPLAAHAASWQLGGVVAMALLQGVLLVRTFVRAAWLGHALACVQRSDEALPVARATQAGAL